MTDDEARVWTEIESLLITMSEHQESKVLARARRLKPGQAVGHRDVALEPPPVGQPCADAIRGETSRLTLSVARRTREERLEWRAALRHERAQSKTPVAEGLRITRRRARAAGDA